MNKFKYPLIIIVIIVICLLSYYLLIKKSTNRFSIEADNGANLYKETDKAELVSEDIIVTHNDDENKKVVEDINKVIDSQSYGKCGVYVKNLQTGEEIKINEDKEFYPASIYKVPLSILILKDVDDGKISLDDEYTVNYSHIAYDFDPLASQVSNIVSVRYLLELLIKNSDNTAQKLLVNEVIGSYEKYNERINDELDIDGFQGDFETLSVTPQQVGKLFENIHNQEYLSSKSNDYLVDLLSNTSSNFDDRIVAGIPDDIQTAHKIGQLDDIYQDAGIVFGDNDYVVILLNEKIMSYELASEKVSKISNIIWNYFNN